MKTPLLKTLVAASILLTLGSTGRAQVMTSSTITGFDATVGYNQGLALGDALALSQTFSNITSVESVTFRFIANVGDSFASTDLNYVFSSWAGNNAGAPLSPAFQQITISESSSWITAESFKYFDADVNLTAFGAGLSSGATFGLTVVGNTDSATAGYRLAASPTAFTEGSAFFQGGVTTFGDLTSGNVSVFSGFDFAFAGTELTAVPEAGSVAVLFSGLFVGFMVFSRSRQRRVAVAVEA
jgi:hypothetical protein